MIKRIIAFIASIINELVKMLNWWRNPTNGKGNYVTPSQRHYLSSGMTLIAIFVYRTGEGLYNLAMSLVFDVLAPLVSAIIGIGSDLWHSNPNYSQKAFWGIVSVVQITLSVVFAAVMLIIDIFRK